jgi:hypothetical protein
MTAKKWIDLTPFVDLSTFPWLSIPYGIAKSERRLATFTDDAHQQIGYDAKRFKDREEWRWYNTIAKGIPVNGFVVPLNEAQDIDGWENKTDDPIWVANKNMDNFSLLQDWIGRQQCFTHTGRQLFFIQFNGQATTKHVDLRLNEESSDWRKDPVEFIWLSVFKNGKRMIIDGELVDSQCIWFNNSIPHWTEMADQVKWSFRVEGKFTEAFKHKIGWYA